MLMLVSVKVPPLMRRLEIILEKTQQRKLKMCESNEEGGRVAVALGLNIYIFVWQKDIEFGWHQKLSSFPALSVASCVALGKFFHLSETQFFHLNRGSHNT